MPKHVDFGDLLEWAADGEFDAIIHGCNCQNTMGSGIARQIREKYPAAYEADTAFAQDRAPARRLGRFSKADVGDFVIYNAYTQLNYGREPSARYVSYEAIARSLSGIAADLSPFWSYGDRQSIRIGYPLIGAGLGGGNWSIISAIIDDQLRDFTHTLILQGDMKR